MTDHAMPEGVEAPPRGTRAMAIVRWALVAIMALAAVAATAYYAGWFADVGGEAPSGTIYYCPMHPSVQQDHPGECPICSMTLVLMPTGDAGVGPSVPPQVPGLAPVTLSPDRIQRMGMRTAPVVREALATELRVPGTVAASEKGLAVVQTRFAGWIEELLVEQTGQKVTKGQVLARIYSPDLLTAQQELLSALRWEKSEAAGSMSAGLAGDARKRLELLGISKQEIAEIQKTGSPMRAIPVRSLVTGYVTAKTAVQGAYVQPGDELFRLADLSTLSVLADVYEYEAGRVTIGQPATFTAVAYPGEQFAGKVTFIQPALDAASRTLRARIELPNRDLRLKPGMFGDVELASQRIEALVIPADAFVDTGEHQYVFVAQEGGRFEPRRVRAGARVDGKVQILEGLSEGEVVVTTANFLLDSESRLQSTISGGSGAPTPAGDVCETNFDKQRHPDKYQQCVACRMHRGMGSMEEDCRAAIPKPWK
jgi:membrane fusion protein, copper/silver efflux system